MLHQSSTVIIGAGSCWLFLRGCGCARGTLTIYVCAGASFWANGSKTFTKQSWMLLVGSSFPPNPYAGSGRKTQGRPKMIDLAVKVQK
jgi:hypothetical protein